MQTAAPGNTVVTVGSVPIVQLAKGTFIEIDFEADAFTDEVAADGSVVRILSADRRGTIKLVTDMASPSNAYLTRLAVNDRLTGVVVVPVLVKDTRGPSIAFARQAWIKKIPKKSYATEHTTVEWEIRCANLKSEPGGIDDI